MAAKIIGTMVLEQAPEGRRINIGTMTDLPTLAAILLANFVTIRVPLYEPRWAEPRPELPIEAYYRSRAASLRVEHLIPRCHRQHLRILLLDAGNRAFFDRLEGGGPEGWRLHFFCLDPSTITALSDSDIGTCGPGDTTFDAEEFVAHRLRQLQRADRLDQPDKRWCHFD